MRSTLTALSLLVLFLLPAQVFPAGFGQPSNPAGVWEMTFSEGTHLISFPVLPENATVTSVLGQEFPGGFVWEDATRIIGENADTMAGSYFSNMTGEWIGDLVDLQAKRAYWLILPDGVPDEMLQLIGAALPMAEAAIDTLYPGLNFVACPAVVPVTLAGSGLTESGCVSAYFAAKADRVYTWDSGLLVPAWRNPDQGWVGANFTFHPGYGYIVERASGDTGIEWIRPELIVGAEPPRGGEHPVVSPALTPMLRQVNIDFNVSPGSMRQRSRGGQR